MSNLVIVESPTKSKTLQRFLGSGYQIEASMGHVRDLPKSDMGVDVENNFEPKYIIPKDKIKRVNELKKIASGVKTLWLATDPDREGEAIAWHLEQLLTDYRLQTTAKKQVDGSPREATSRAGEVGRQKPAEIKRVVFHEITPEAIKEAFENPHRIDQRLVDAQQARRVLDRLVGYKLSPLLWKKVKSGLSAGRVQSVALRLIVEREREVAAFKPQEYWSIEAKLRTYQTLDSGQQRAEFIASLAEQNGKKIKINNQGQAQGHVSNLQAAAYQVSSLAKKEVRRHPAPPFTTSTLQQTAANRLGFTAKKTMMLAQALYERGFITYMRTDSVNLSDFALKSARDYIGKNIGPQYLPKAARVFKTKSKVAQEAHEAIRPTNMGVTADKLRGQDGLMHDHLKLYDLIWKRMIASQMSGLVADQVIIEVKADVSQGISYKLRAVGEKVKFEGWRKIYGKDTEDEENSRELPEPPVGEKLDLLKVIPSQHFTEPPARYNEASLIKKLEELGIGRPSTYAPILSTILERYYVERKERRLFPTELGIAVTDFLVKNFPDIFDYAFTAQMEEELDEIARGERQWRSIMSEFYKPFEKKVGETEEKAQRVQIEAEIVDKKCPQCGKNLQIKFGRFGKFLACSGFPECKYTENLQEKIDAKCPKCGGEIVARRTKKGRTFYGCKNYPKCDYASWNKPGKTASS